MILTIPPWFHRSSPFMAIQADGSLARAHLPVIEELTMSGNAFSRGDWQLAKTTICHIDSAAAMQPAAHLA
jgi:hypothetical protein